MKPQPRVYSYTRFSTKDQAKGDSERRQIEAAENYAKSKGLTLDDTLTPDRGLSGFHGMHRKRGVLGGFLEKVKLGEVPKGSILLIENVDRLSREPVATAQQTILDLLNHDITIITLSPFDEFTLESYNKGGHWRMSAHIERAHSESQRKSDLAKVNWTQKRKQASRMIITKLRPAWLRMVDGRFEVIPEAAEAVRMIYRLRLEGFGVTHIAKKLNASGPWIPPERKNRKTLGWHPSYLEKILRTRAVIGEYQLKTTVKGKLVPTGDPVPNYFPVIIQPKEFHAVQVLKANNRGKGGRNGKLSNPFRSLCKCGYCGGPMVFIDNGAPTPKRYLVCDNGRRSVRDDNGKQKCAGQSVPYDEFAATMLDNLAKLRPETVLPNTDEQAQQAAVVRDSIVGIGGQLADMESKVNNLVAQIASTSNPGMRSRYEKLAGELEAKKPELEAERTRLESALRELERSQQSFSKWQRDLAALKQLIAEDTDARVRLKAHLTELVEKIVIYGRGHQDNIAQCEALIDQMPELERSKHFPAFKRFMEERLLSRDGRFYDLHLRRAKALAGRLQGQGIRIAPAASLAARMVIRGKDTRHEGPELGKLLKEFFDGRKPGFVPKGSKL